MRLTVRAIAVLLALVLVAPGSDLSAKKKKKKPGPKEKLFGEYYWDDRGGVEGDLEAVFTPDGENRWKVIFFFVYEKQVRHYRGTAEGSLSEGTLGGKVVADTLENTYSFSGEFDDRGVFRGIHQAVLRERQVTTGTLMLWRKGAKPE